MKFQLSSHEEYQEIAVGGQTGGNLGPMGSYRSEIVTKVSSWLELMGALFGQGGLKIDENGLNPAVFELLAKM